MYHCFFFGVIFMCQYCFASLATPYPPLPWAGGCISYSKRSCLVYLGRIDSECVGTRTPCMGW